MDINLFLGAYIPRFGSGHYSDSSYDGVVDSNTLINSGFRTGKKGGYLRGAQEKRLKRAEKDGVFIGSTGQQAEEEKKKASKLKDAIRAEKAKKGKPSAAQKKVGENFDFELWHTETEFKAPKKNPFKP